MNFNNASKVTNDESRYTIAYSDKLQGILYEPQYSPCTKGHTLCARNTLPSVVLS